MARILFKPTCSNCGQIIPCRVDCYDSFDGIDRGIIEPQECPFCDAHFRQIAIPVKLPFTGFEKQEGDQQ